jgi:hypothetical protein
MNIVDIRSQWEIDLSWRTEEIRFLRNQLGLMRGRDERERFYRTLLVMLYAHLEGFTKSAIRLYIRAICDEQIATSAVNIQLRGTRMDPVLAGIDQPEPAFFLEQPPIRHHLVRAFRIRELLDRWNELMSAPFDANPDDVANTESNLKCRVLRRILFRAGLQMNRFKDFEEDLESLVSRRHPIAHGETDSIVKESDYVRLETNALLFMEELVRVLTSALVEQDYLAA